MRTKIKKGKRTTVDSHRTLHLMLSMRST